MVKTVIRIIYLFNLNTNLYANRNNRNKNNQNTILDTLPTGIFWILNNSSTVLF